MELVGSNIVVTAAQFNPSIFSQSWLVKNEIIGSDEIEPPTMFVENMSQVNTKRFQIFVVPPMLQFNLRPETIGDDGGLIAMKVGKIVESLPHTPYLAIGINFTWHVTPQNEDDIRRLSRRMFFMAESALYAFFDEDNAQFGGYMSKNFGPFRLKLDIKPITHNDGISPPAQKMMFAFNFNRDLKSESAVSQMLECISAWDSAKAESEKIVLSSRTLEAK